MTAPSSDNATFVADITIPDGTVVTPGQALHKVWRVRNTGTSTWGSGYQLAFVGGDQMGAPSAVDVPATAPVAEVDIAVDMTAPGQSGDYTGYWRFRNAQGTYFGQQIWMAISVSGTSPPPSDVIELTCLDCPGVVTPGQQFRPTIRATVRTGQLLESRGDMLRNVDGDLFGAWPHIAVVGTVNAGESYDFTFYADHPLTAPTEEGTYETKWRVWRDGDWAGQEIAIRFDVLVGGGIRPDPPSLVSPNDWWVSRDGSTPQLCASAPGGLQYYFQIYESHDTPESGWIGSSCWTPPTLGPYTYQWHVKVRDPGSGLESDWSTTWHFSIDSQELTIDPLEFVPGSPSAAEEVRVYTCVRGFGGIGLALKIEANTATDGSANGEWQWIHHLGTFCYNHDDPNTWPNWGTLPLANGTHLIRATGYHNGETVVAEATYTLQHRRPTAPHFLSPVGGIKINTRTVTFRWEPGMEATGDDPRTSEYQLLVSENADPSINPLLNVTLGGDTTSYVHTFGADYPSLHWRVIARNTLGESGNTTEFGIDRVSPDSSIATLPPAVTEIQFVVQWGGSDNLSGVRWYDVQYRDGPRGDWVDWLMSTTTTAAIFSGQTGHTYYFRSRALDNAGNLEDWPGGDGDTHATVDLGAVPPTPWWNSDYSFKRNLLVLNNDSQALPVGYPIRLHFDSGTVPTSMELYAASQSAIKGDDVRVVYGNTTELPRFVQSFQNDVIDLWFNLQVGIAPNPGQDNISYQLYYGNPAAANPPGDVNSVLPPGTDANTMGVWYFQEPSGTSLFDSSGRGHTGTINNGSRSPDGKFGGTVVFNGSSTWLNMGDHPDFDVRSFTLEGWFYFSPPGTQALMRRDRTDHQENAYHFGTRDTRVEFGIDGRSPLRSETHFQPNRWYHVAVTYDESTMRVFVNGVEEASQSETGGTPASVGPLVIGVNIGGGDWFSGQMQHIRVSNTARSSFPYGGFANILSDPSSAAGAEITPPTPGSADLILMGMTAYPNPASGVLVQAVVLNQGDKATQNGFYTDLYVDHLPTGPGDFTGSISFWVDDSIEPGTTVTLTTVLTDVASLAGRAPAEPLGESTVTLYSQADSQGVVGEPDDSNNISAGLDVCVASPDQYEDDDTAAAARWIALGSTQSRNFDGMGDQDWLKFSAQAGEAYTLSTSDLGTAGDTYLHLYDTDRTTLLAANDDYGGSLASHIEWTAPANGTYYLLVKHWNPNMGGCGTSYDLNLRQGGAVQILYLPLVLRSYTPPVPTPTPSPPAAWTDPFNVSANSSESRVTQLAVDSEQGVHVVWMDNGPGNYDIFYRHKPANGSWSTVSNLSQNDGESGAYAHGAAIVADSADTVHVIWADDTPGTSLLYTYKPRDGTWATTQNLTTLIDGISPAITVDPAGKLYVTWTASPSGNWDILYAEKAPGGQWTAPVNASNTSGDSYNSVVAVGSDGIVHVAWEDYTYGFVDILYAMRDASKSWGVPVNLSNNTGASHAPAIAISEGTRIHVVWYDGTPGNPEVLYSTKPGGGNWSLPLNVSSNSGWSTFPVIAAAPDGRVFAVWHDTANGADEILFSSKRYNEPWSAPIPISGPVVPSFGAVVAWGDNNALHVVWEGDDPRDIYYSTGPAAMGQE